MARIIASVFTAFFLVSATTTPAWVERIFARVQAGRESAAAGSLARRPALDAAAEAYAKEVAALPHSQRLIQRGPIGRFLEDAGIEHFHEAKLHLDMGLGYRDWGEKFSRSWVEYEAAWASVTDPRYDALGLGVATAQDNWVVLVGILVDDIEIPTDLRALERGALEGVNEIRAEHGLDALVYDEELAGFARAYGERMIRLGFFSHTGPDGTTLEQRAQAGGIRYEHIGENLHKSTGYDDPVPVALAGWMKSPGHRKNILDATYTHTGVGVAIDEDGGVIFTQLFLLPLARTD